MGRDYPEGDTHAAFHPLIKPTNTQPLQLFFCNLIEANALRGFRTEHGVALVEFRKAMAYVERKLHLHRLLLRPELRTHAGKVFSTDTSSSSI
ncbi:MAG: hypothetical protein ACXW20_22000 [Burkholderiales bacterium]